MWFPVGLVLAAFVGWGVWPSLFYAQKVQPFSFNHIVHTDRAGLDCEACHYFDESGRFSGAPGLDECLKCHAWPNRRKEDSEFELAFLREFVTVNGELTKSPAWRIYAQQPDHVYFPHALHVKAAGVRCEHCHGDHDRTSGLRPYYENRLTGYSREMEDRLKMADCTSCHNNYAASHTDQGRAGINACFTCHR